MYIREINEFTIIWGKLNMKRKIACVLLGAVSLQLLSCGQHESNETLTEPNYVLQEYETTKSENGYSIVNDFMVYDEPSPSGLYVYYPYVEEKKKGVNYLDDMYIRGHSARDEDLQGEARPDGTSSKIGNSACDSMIVNAWSTPDFALKYNSDSSKGVVLVLHFHILLMMEIKNINQVMMQWLMLMLQHILLHCMRILKIMAVRYVQ